MRIKRFDETHFILCDEYETVETLKGRLLLILNQIGYTIPKLEEDLSVDHIRLTLKNRVSYTF